MLFAFEKNKHKLKSHLQDTSSPTANTKINAGTRSEYEN